VARQVSRRNPALGQAWAKFIPFLDYDVEIRRIICSANVIESLTPVYRFRGTELGLPGRPVRYDLLSLFNLCPMWWRSAPRSKEAPGRTGIDSIDPSHQELLLLSCPSG
jgi:hypothetical protein